MCKTALEHNETLPSPQWNCNGKGDDVIARNGPGGLFNKDWSCESRLDHNQQANVTYFQTETIFHPHNMVSWLLLPVSRRCCNRHVNRRPARKNFSTLSPFASHLRG